MFTAPPITRRRLPVRPGQIDRLDPVATVICTHGTLWVTQAGDSRDHLLHPGDRFTPDPRAGHTLIQALSPDASAVVSSASAPDRPQPRRFFPTFNVVWRTVFSR